MTIITYESNILRNTGKKGILKPDADGRYEMVLGAFNYANNHKDFYPFGPVRNMFESSSPFMRRVEANALRGEYGHPKRDSVRTEPEFIRRVMEIRETQVCCYYNRIQLNDQDRVAMNGEREVVVTALVKPSGPYGTYLEESLKDPNQNCSFSVRTLTNDVPGPQGGMIKTIRLLVTWDYVNEPGIALAHKYNSPSLESIDGYSFDLDTLMSAAEDVRSGRFGVGMESDAKDRLYEAVRIFREKTELPNTRIYLPPSAKW